jgi:hypothetical protein
MTIHKCTFLELEALAGYPELVAEYAEEGRIPGMPAPQFDPRRYRQLCEMGVLHTRISVIDERLVGFVLVLTTVLPKYSIMVAVTEAFFVGSAHRMSGAGLRLLRVAEAIAAQHAGGRLLVSAPFGGALSEVLPRVGYAETNRVFFKQVTYG